MIQYIFSPGISPSFPIKFPHPGHRHGIVQGPEPQAPQDRRVEVHQDVGFAAALHAFAAGETRQVSGRG